MPTIDRTNNKETAVKFDTIAAGVYPELVYPPYKSTLKRGPLQPLLRIAAPVPVSDNIAPSPRLSLIHI